MRYNFGTFQLSIITLLMVILLLFCGCKAQSNDPSASQNQPQTEDQPVVSPPTPLDSLFYPSGWMGDGASGGKQLKLTYVSTSIEGDSLIAAKIDYAPGNVGWAGIYWQYPENNWGKKPGRDISEYTRISFYARSDRDNTIAEFKSGGIKDPQLTYRDAYSVTTGKTGLDIKWRQFTLDLRGADRASVIGGFCWSMAKPDDGNPVQIYIARLQLEK